MRVTVADVMALDPCDDYSEDILLRLADGREYLSASEIAGLNIPSGDRLWVLAKLLWDASPWRSRRLARRIALDVVPYDCDDIVWWYLVTGDVNAREAAREAARAAWAAWDAARDAAMDAWDAARDAARAAARAAARDAARDAAIEKYIGWFVEGLEG